MTVHYRFGIYDLAVTNLTFMFELALSTGEALDLLDLLGRTARRRSSATATSISGRG